MRVIDNTVFCSDISIVVKALVRITSDTDPNGSHPNVASTTSPSTCGVDSPVILGSGLHHAVLRAKHMTIGRPVCSRWSGLATGSWGCAAKHTIASEPPTSIARKV